MQTAVDEPETRRSLLSTGGVEVELDAPALIPEISERGRRFLRGLNEILETVLPSIELPHDPTRPTTPRATRPRTST